MIPPTPAVATAAGRKPSTEALAGLVGAGHLLQRRQRLLRAPREGAQAERDLVTVVGHAATIAAGEWVQMSGTWTNDRTHGLQLKAAFLKASPPTTLEEIKKYLGSRHDPRHRSGLRDEAGHHHKQALCAVATRLINRIYRVLRTVLAYELHDTDGTPVSVAQGRIIVAERFSIPAEIRNARRRHRAEAIATP